MKRSLHDCDHIIRLSI